MDAEVANAGLTNAEVMNTKVSHVVFEHERSPLGQVKFAGELRNSPGVPRRVFGLYAVVLVTGGRGRFRDDYGFSCDLEPGDLLVLFPEVGHRYGPRRGGYWHELFVVFEGAAFDLWRAQGVLRPEAPHVRLGRADYWRQRLKAVLWQDAGPGRTGALGRLCRFQEILAEMLEDPQRGGKDAWLERASALLQAHVAERADYPALSAELGMSYEGFRKRFTREAGVSPGRYLMQRRMQRACDLLVGEPLSVRAVGQELGFFDEFHFSKQFKRSVGMTPAAFRKLFR